ncbi:MAG: hypothetical protein Q4B48_05350 [Syntrophomonadaceae bacterium]|nr:hypothetical protein [Syntrophomonadaceae bacterium]
MSKRLAAARAALRDENRGSTIIVVIVAVAFVAVLGSLLLFMSMINIQMKSMDRQGRDTFYDAETALNEMRLHLQEASSWAIREAYPVFLAEDYADKVAEDDEDGQDAAVEAFNRRFVEKLLEYEVHVGGSDTKLLNGSGYTVTGYDVAVLQSFVDSSYVTITIDGDESATTGTVKDTDDALILKAVKLELEQNGYRSTIVTDLCLNKPLFYDSRSDELLNYVVVAKERFDKPAGGGVTEVRGNVYAKEVTIAGEDQTLTVDDQERRVVCAGELTNFGKLTVSDGSELWAQRVVVGAETRKGEVNLLGSSFVADDLDLAGNGSKAVVEGEYYGFGNALDDGTGSSGIVINGKDTRLDMSGVTGLMLAGHTYIKANEPPGLANTVELANDEVMMGESISVKSNQLAYMIPSNAVTGTATITGNSNPLLVSNIDLENLLNGVELKERNKAIKNALVAPAYQDRTRLMFINTTVNGADAKLIYFFNSNNSVSQRRAEANRQFENYFERNSHVMPIFFSRLTDEIDLPAAAGMEMSGHAVEYTGGTVNLRRALTAASPLASASHQYERTFSRLCHTLSPTVHCSGRHGVDAADQVTPYDHYVKQAAVEKLDEGIGDPLVLTADDLPLLKVLVVNNPDDTFIVSSTDVEDLSSIRLIIARRDVEVQNDFTGLIIAGGEVKVVTGTLTAMSDDDKEKIKAMPEVSEYLNLMTNETDSPWDMENLVTYQNWSKE